MLDVIEDSIRQSSTVDYDGVSIALHCSSLSLGRILNDVLMCGHYLGSNIVSSLRELHICMTHLSVEWETRLVQLSHGSSPPKSSSLGHPTVFINIPVVCQRCYAILILGTYVQCCALRG